MKTRHLVLPHAFGVRNTVKALRAQACRTDAEPVVPANHGTVSDRRDASEVAA